MIVIRYIIIITNMSGICCCFGLIDLFVVRGIRTYLFIKRNMKIKPKFIYILKLIFDALIGRNFIFKYYMVLFSQQFLNLISRKIYK
jgi:hypothetical protein